jgi:acyl-coenzyme A thioesterase 13
MDPEAVRRTLEPTASPEDISGSTPYDSFVISGVRLDAAEHGRVLFSFVVTPRHAVSRPSRPKPFEFEMVTDGVWCLVRIGL